MRAEQKVVLPAPAGPMTRTPNFDMLSKRRGDDYDDDDDEMLLV